MELIDLALSMENDLMSFYRRQAELHKGSKLCAVFHLLENEEENHAKILHSYKEQIVLPLTDSGVLAEAKAIFKEVADIKLEVKELPSQLDVYRTALEKEEQSLKFYKDLSDKVDDERSKQVFSFLIKQEDIHCIILEELIKLVSRPEEWVESAEFGLRDDY